MPSMAPTIRKATAADAFTPWPLEAYQRARYGAVEPPKWLWIAVATDEAFKAGLDPEDIIDGYKGHKAARCRWRAWRRLLDMPEGYTVSGVGRITGWSHTDILYGMRRLRGIPAKFAHGLQASPSAR